MRTCRILARSAVLPALAVLLSLASPALALGPELGERAPELLVKDWVNGGPFVLADLEGNVVVVLFLHTSLPDMDKYVKGYVNLLTTYGDRGLKVIGISRERRDLVLNWADEQQLNFPIALDDGSWTGNYGIDGYPFTYVIDIYGEIAWKGDGNRIEWVTPQVETCMKEVKRITVKRDATSKNFDKVWRALDRNEYANAIKFLQTIAKGSNDDDRGHAETMLADLAAMADARLKRAEELAKRKDYVSGEAVLRVLEKLFAGFPQAKAAREMRETWFKDPEIRTEFDAQRCYEEGRRLEQAKHYKQAADCYRAANAYPRTRAAGKARKALAELVRKGLAKN